MANRYFVGGSGNWSDTAHWSTSSGGATGASVPGTSDVAITDVLSNALAYTITLDVSPSCAGYTIGAPLAGNLTIVGGASKTINLTIGSSGITVTGTPNIGGNSAVNRLFVVSNTIGTARTITSTGATVAWTNTDFRDITSSPAIDLSAQTDIGGGTLSGCSGITFPAGINCFWKATNTGSKNWSSVTASVPDYWFTTSGGSTPARVPLMQDTAVFDANSFSNTGSTVVQDMPRIPGVTWVGVGAGAVTNVPTWTTSTVASVFGGITLHTATTGMVLTASAQNYTFEGRGSYAVTMAGNNFAKALRLTAPGGTLTSSDAFQQSDANGLTITNGDLNSGGFNFTSPKIISAAPSTINITNSLVILTGSGNAWYPQPTTTVIATGSTIKLTYSGATTTQFVEVGSGRVYNNLWISPGAGTAQFNILSGNTISQLKDDGSAAHSVKFTKSTTTTVADWQIGTPASRGANVNVITLDTVDGAGTMTIAVPANSGIIADYLNVQRMVVTGANAKFWAGGYSVNNNGAGSGVLFNAPPQVLLEGIRGY
jgi:hypothetical protein